MSRTPSGPPVPGEPGSINDPANPDNCPVCGSPPSWPCRSKTRRDTKEHPARKLVRERMSTRFEQERFNQFIDALNDENYPLPAHKIDVAAERCSCGAVVSVTKLDHFYDLFDEQQRMAENRAAARRAARER